MIYSKTSDDVLYINLFISSYVEIPAINGKSVAIDLRTDYPWDGKVNIHVRSTGEFAIKVRIPGWVENGASVSINGAPVEEYVPPGEYFEICRQWEAGDRLRLNLPMEPRTLISHPAVLANQCRVAFQRGPLVYCLEGEDNPSVDPNRFLVMKNMAPTTRFNSGILDGVVVLEGEGVLENVEGSWGNKLYQGVDSGGVGVYEPESWTAVPYYAWANREQSWMQVWVRSNSG